MIKKSDNDTKIAEIESKYVSNTGFNSKLTQANAVTKRNFDAKIIELENNIRKLQTFDSSYFRGKNYFDEDGTQNYLVFLPIGRYFRLTANKKTSHHGNLKGYLMKLLHLMLLLIIVLLHGLIIMVPK